MSFAKLAPINLSSRAIHGAGTVRKNIKLWIKMKYNENMFNITRRTKQWTVLIAFFNPSRKVIISQNRILMQIPKQIPICTLMDEVVPNIIVLIGCRILICLTCKTVLKLWVKAWISRIILTTLMKCTCSEVTIS
jgi:hypothetical protein